MIFQGPHGSVNAGSRNIAARRLIGVASLCMISITVSGCYAFIPTNSDVVPSATPVSISLTEDGTSALRSVLGQGVNEVDGTILRTSADTVVVAVENTYTNARQKFSSSGTTASIPRSFINQVKVRTFSRKRTVLTVVGGVALAVVAGASAKAGGVFGDGGGNPPTTPP